jgi:hypothetical protein
MKILLTTLLWLPVTALPGATLPLAQEQKAPAAAKPLVVGNEEGKLTPLSPEEWAKLPRRKAEAKDREGKAIAYEGASLADVLRFGGVPFDGHLKGPRVASYVLVEAADGYRAVLALAEVDPSVAEKVVLLADRLDGKPLAAAVGPYRLVVPGDKIHSRWVRQVIRITVHRAPAAAARPPAQK